MPVIEILGRGCTKCQILAERAESAARGLGLDYRLVKVTEMADIMARGVLSTPAMVVDGVVKVQGQVPSEATIAGILNGKS